MKLAVQTKATVINIRVHEACSEMFYSGQGRCGLNNYLLIFYILFEIEPANSLENIAGRSKHKIISAGMGGIGQNSFGENNPAPISNLNQARTCLCNQAMFLSLSIPRG